MPWARSLRPRLNPSSSLNEVVATLGQIKIYLDWLAAGDREQELRARVEALEPVGPLEEELSQAGESTLRDVQKRSCVILDEASSVAKLTTKCERCALFLLATMRCEPVKLAAQAFSTSSMMRSRSQGDQ